MKILHKACLSVLAGIVSLPVLAQRSGTVKTISTNKLVDVQQLLEQTESIRLEAGHEMLVTPLIASVKVLTTNSDDKTFKHRTFTGSARQNIPDGLNGNEYLVPFPQDRWTGEDYERELDKLKAQVIYDFCRETGADLIVLPQFNIQSKTQWINAVDANGQTIRQEQPIKRGGKYVMIVEAVGFPAVYTGFREGVPEDTWIKSLYRMGQINFDEKQIRRVEETVSTRE